MNDVSELNRVSEDIWNKNNISMEEVDRELRQIEKDFRLPEGYRPFGLVLRYWHPLIRIAKIFEVCIDAIDNVILCYNADSDEPEILKKANEEQVEKIRSFRNNWRRKRVGLIENHKDLKGVAGRIKEIEKIFVEEITFIPLFWKCLGQEVKKNMSKDDQRLCNILLLNAYTAPFVEEGKRKQHLYLKGNRIGDINLEGIKSLTIEDGRNFLFWLKSRTVKLVILMIQPKEKLDIGLSREDFFRIRKKCPKLELLVTSRKKSIIARICSIVFNPLNLIRWIWGKIRGVKFTHFERLLYYGKRGCENIGDLARSGSRSARTIEHLLKKAPRKFDVFCYKNFAT